MILSSNISTRAALRRRGMTLTELLVGMGIGSIILTVVALFTVFGARSFVSLGNYSALDQQSRLGIDQMTRELRQATALVKTNASPKGLVFTNATKGITVNYYLTSSTKELWAKYSNEANPRRLLTGCDSWDFELWQRTPTTNDNVFFPASTPSSCKLVNMTWKCSRSVGGTKRQNTETIQTTLIVLRNQQSN